MTDLFDIIYSDHPKSAIFFLFFVVVKDVPANSIVVNAPVRIFSISKD